MENKVHTDIGLLTVQTVFIFMVFSTSIVHKLICLWTVSVCHETPPTASHRRFIPSKNKRHASAGYANSLLKKKEITHNRWRFLTRHKTCHRRARRSGTSQKLFQDADWLPVWNGPGRDRQDGPQSRNVDSFEDGLEKLVSHWSRSAVCLLPPALFSEYVTGHCISKVTWLAFFFNSWKCHSPPDWNPFAPLWQVSACGFSCRNVFEGVSLSQRGVLIRMRDLCDLENGVGYRIYYTVCWCLFFLF